jgi:hypothetical protein
MRHPITTLVLVGGLAGSTVALAAAPRTHAVRGVVSKVDARSLVIMRTHRKPSDVFFSLTPSTLREGTIAVGSTVYVRYRIEGDTLVATAVVARE